MNFNLLKCWLCSTGIACIISAPISGSVMQSWENPKITEYQETPAVSTNLIVDNANKLNFAQSKSILICVEQRRQDEIINDARYILEVYQVEVPADIQEYCEKAGAEFNICPELLEAICWKESRFTADAEGGGCSGLMQISVRWHRQRMDDLGVSDIYDPEGNIRVGASYLADLFAKYDGNLDKVLKEYNGDTSKGVSTYVLEIETISEALERVHGK